MQVWATDLWFSASDNLQRVRDANVDDGVFPIDADARSLPFASEFFDAVVCIYSFVYYGTDDLFEISRWLPQARWRIGCRRGRLDEEIYVSVPDHLRARREPSMGCLDSAGWWRRHWKRTGIIDIDLADTLPDGRQFWRDWQSVVALDNTVDIQALEADRGSHLGYVRLVGRRRLDECPDEPIVSMPTVYTNAPLLRSSE